MSSFPGCDKAPAAVSGMVLLGYFLLWIQPALFSRRIQDKK